MTLPKRQKQAVVGRFGTLYVSPLKKQDKRKTSTIVARLGHDAKLQSLREKMAAILDGKAITSPNATSSATVDPAEAEWEDVSMGVPEDLLSTSNVLESNVTVPAKANTRRLLPNASDNTLFDRWKNVMPTLVDPLISYLASTHGRELVPKVEIKSLCDDVFCARRTAQILCLFLDREYF